MKRPAVWGLWIVCGCTAAVSPSAPVTDAQATVEAQVEVVKPDPPPPPPAPCPTEMVLAEGEYCPTPIQVCKRWIDPPGPYLYYRCAEYAPSTCKGSRTHEKFCVDREEYVAPGDSLPLANQSWTSAKEV